MMANDGADQCPVPVRLLRQLRLRTPPLPQEHHERVLAGYRRARWVLGLDDADFPAPISGDQDTADAHQSADQLAEFNLPTDWHPMSTHQGVRMKMLYPDRPNREQWKSSWLEFRSQLELEDYKAVMESSSVRFQCAY